MKKTVLLVSIASLVALTAQPANAKTDIQKGFKKCGNAIVWPFKKLGSGVKSVGSGIKNAISK